MKNFILTLLLVGLMAANASAAFTQVDPGVTLPGYTSNIWDITTTGKWLSAELLVQLTGGNIYQNTDVPSNTPPTPANIVSFPALEYDTYMSGGTDTGASTGTMPEVMGGAVDIGGAISLTCNTSLFDATWGSTLDPKPSGALTIGRVTLSDDAQGIYSWRLSEQGNLASGFVNGLIVNGVLTERILWAQFNQEDPGSTLSGYVSNTWNLNTVGEKWLSAELLVELTSGDIYQNTGVGSGDVPPNPAYFATNPALEFDSYMCGGKDSNPVQPLTGTLPELMGGAVDIGGAIPRTFNTSGIDATWGSTLDPKPSGSDLMLGRITLSGVAQGTFKLRIALDDSEPYFYLGGVIVDGGMYFAPPPPPIPGDADGDRDVDAADAAILAGNWLQTIAGGYSVGDFNGDGDVDDIDATIMAANWGYGTATAAVPEPSTICLAISALGMILGATFFRRGNTN